MYISCSYREQYIRTPNSSPLDSIISSNRLRTQRTPARTFRTESFPFTGPSVPSLLWEKYFTVHIFTAFDMLRRREYSESSVHNEYMLTSLTIHEFVKLSKVEDHCDSGYVFKSTWSLSSLLFSILPSTKRNFQRVLFGADKNVFLIIVVPFSDPPPTIRTAIMSSLVTVHLSYSLFTEAPRRTVDISLHSENHNSRAPVSDKIRFHSITLQVLTTNPFCSHYSSSPTSFCKAPWRISIRILLCSETLVICKSFCTTLS